MNGFARWRRNRTLQRHLIAQADFDQAVAGLPILHGLNLEERRHLREQASLLLADKNITAAGGAEVEPAICLALALQACLLTLHLDDDSYRGWNEIILYPDAFLRPQETTDDAGVVHVSRDLLAGESWHGGPLVLSIADVLAGGQAEGFNVVLHEFAHKLDMLNGDANGFPPLHRGMNSATWAQTLEQAYEDLCARVAQDEYTVIDPYAAQSPAEFFAVLTEVFFETPESLFDTYPAVYDQFRQFYRQDPLARRTA